MDTLVETHLKHHSKRNSNELHPKIEIVSDQVYYSTMGAWMVMFLIFFGAFCYCTKFFDRGRVKPPKFEMMTSLNGEVEKNMNQFTSRFQNGISFPKQGQEKSTQTIVSFEPI